ncbi:MAG: cytochrome c peroxidase [Campylobacterota bacterium]|nr:cytochrome c peroxidase [Campylobacterota bacterium]
MIKKSFLLYILFFLETTVLFSVDFVPLPISVEVEDKKVQLGKKLFSDTILSKDKTLSCMSCHNLLHNGADTTALTKGINGKLGVFNVPTVYNSTYNFRQFWDGRAKNLKEQALNPIINPVEMGSSMPEVLQDLENSKVYPGLFNAIYKDGITEDNLADVLAEFEKTLITPNSPFDRFLNGDEKALSTHAYEGYRLFKEKGCVSCHNGINIGGNLYNKFGIYKDAKSEELGRYNTTKKEADKYVFKVPSLRNIALTAPYMHDGRAKTMEEAVNIMTQYQLGRPMDKDDLHRIVDFLNALTGDLPESVKDMNVSHQ